MFTSTQTRTPSYLWSLGWLFLTHSPSFSTSSHPRSRRPREGVAISRPGTGEARDTSEKAKWRQLALLVGSCGSKLPRWRAPKSLDDLKTHVIKVFFQTPEVYPHVVLKSTLNIFGLEHITAPSALHPKLACRKT